MSPPSPPSSLSAAENYGSGDESYEDEVDSEDEEMRLNYQLIQQLASPPVALEEDDDDLASGSASGERVQPVRAVVYNYRDPTFDGSSSSLEDEEEHFQKIVRSKSAKKPISWPGSASVSQYFPPKIIIV